MFSNYCICKKITAYDKKELNREIACSKPMKTPMMKTYDY